MVVEDHRHRQMGEHALHRGEFFDEGRQRAAFARIAFPMAAIEARGWFEVDQSPRDRRPGEQVHREHLTQRDQVIVGIHGGEDRLLHAAEQHVDQRTVALASGKQSFAAVVAGRMRIEVDGIGKPSLARLREGLAGKAQAFDQTVDRRQHRPGDIIHVDLIAREHERRRPRGQSVVCGPCVGGVLSALYLLCVRGRVRGWPRVGAQQVRDQPVRACQPVASVEMRFAAGAVQHCADARRQQEPRREAAFVAEARRRARAFLPGGCSDTFGIDRLQRDLVADPTVARQRCRHRRIQQQEMQPGAGPQCVQAIGTGLEHEIAGAIEFVPSDREPHACGCAGGEPDREAFRGAATQDGARQQQRQGGVRRLFGHRVSMIGSGAMTPTEDSASSDPALRGPCAAAGPAALRARVAQDLEWLKLPVKRWTLPMVTRAGHPVHDVLIVGAGMFGLAAAARLLFKGVGDILVLDRAPRGSEGPWTTFARMSTLRSGKDLPGVSMGLASLSFRAWFEAHRGADAWAALYKIPNADWQHYLGWLRDVLNLPVRNDCAVSKLSPRTDHVEVALADGSLLRAKRVVVATGRPGAGGAHWPCGIDRSMAPALAAHSSDPIDFAALAGRRVAVIGAGASAWDNAASALEAGAAQVQMFCRRAVLPQINKARANANPGFFEGWSALESDRRWALANYLDRVQAPPPHESVHRVLAHAGFRLHRGTPVGSARPAGRKVVLALDDGREQDFDFLILATGFRTDLVADPLFAELSKRFARWSDRYQPPAELQNRRLGAMPFLGEGFELLEREPWCGDPVSKDDISRIHVFNGASFASFGALALDVPSLDIASERIAVALCRHLFRQDFDGLREWLEGWEEERELDGTPLHDWDNITPPNRRPS